MECNELAEVVELMRRQFSNRRGYILITRTHIKEQWQSSSEIADVRVTEQSLHEGSKPGR